MKVLNIENLIDCIKIIYGFHLCELDYVISSNPPIMRICADNCRYLVKVNNRPINQKFMDLNKRYEITEMLYRENVRIPNTYKVIKSKEENKVIAHRGDSFFYYDSLETTLFEWLEFEQYAGTYDVSFDSTIELCNNLEQSFGRIYNKREQIDYEYENKIREYTYGYICNDEFDFEQLNSGINKFLGEYSELIKSVHRYLIEYKENIVQSLENIPISYVHADINLNNIGYINNKAEVLMDFERVRYGFGIEDMAMCMFELCINRRKECEITECIRKFMDKSELRDFEDIMLYIICSRLQRHIYRGVENLKIERKLHNSFYSVFVDGLKKTYKYITNSLQI